MVLNKEQNEALDSMIRFCEDKDDEPFFCLSGYAGTGKTTTIQALVQKVDPMRVAFTAPTNKAANVLKRMAERKGIAANVDVMTIHSLLGLVVSQQGEQEVCRPKGKNRAKEFDIIVVDECSMVNRELYGFIRDAAEEDMHGPRFIFMGDPAQLPPVGEIASLTFNVEQKAELTIVMRQRGESPVLAACTDVRKAWQDQVSKTIEAAVSQDKKSSVSVLHGQFWEEWMPDAFSHESFDQNHDRFRIIAYRNRNVDYLNQKIQALRYPNLETPFAVGEPIVFSKALPNAAQIHLDPQFAEDRIIAQTEEEGVITHIEQLAPSRYGFKSWDVGVRLLSGKSLNVCFLDPSQVKNYDSNLRELAKAAKEPDGQWLPFWQLKRAFASLRCAYAMTAHKSQGSTFETVFVDVNDILFGNRNRTEALQCLYVACSRASNHLVVNWAQVLAA